MGSLGTYGTTVGPKQKAQLSLTNCAGLFCKVVEVLQDFLSENVDKKVHNTLQCSVPRGNKNEVKIAILGLTY